MNRPRIDLLDSDRIRADLKTKRIGAKVLVFQSTSSTNDVAAEYAAHSNNDGLVILAEEQTKGRGRGGREWRSGRSDSILCSVILIDEKLNSELLSLTCAVAVAEAIGPTAKIKWPNDILVNGKKVAGILLESKSYEHHTASIIGVGINCHQQPDSFAPELRSTATSIDTENRTICDRVSLAKRLLTVLDSQFEAAQRNSGQIIEQWRSLSIQLGHRVALVSNSREFAGNCIGVDPEKGLILQLDSGGVRMFDAAHTTIVK